MEVKLYVGNLAYTTTDADLRTLFSQAGNVVSADLVKDRSTGQSRGFAFVVMSTQAEAQKAIGMFNAFSIHDHEIRVSAAKPREERGPHSPGSRGGAFGNGGGAPRGHGRRGGNRRY